MRTLVIATAIAAVIGTAVFVRDVSRLSSPERPTTNRERIVIFEAVIPRESLQETTVLDDSPASRALLDDPQPSVREDAVESLAELGTSAAITGLRYALSDQSDTVRRLAIEGLASIGSDEAVAAIVLVVDDPDVDLRELAVDELADIGSEAAMVVLQAFLADEDPRVRELAMESLG